MLKGRKVENQRIKCECWEIFVSGVEQNLRREGTFGNLVKLGGKKKTKSVSRQELEKKLVSINQWKTDSPPQTQHVVCYGNRVLMWQLMKTILN